VSLPNEVAKEVGRLPFGHRSGGLRPEPATLSQPKALLTIARGLLGCSLLFLFIFGLTGLFAGV
jgi:hypothetical protein